MSCKLFYFEMKHELVRNMMEYLENINIDWVRSHKSPLKISIPNTLSELGKISVAIPNSYFRARETQFPATRTFSTTLLSLIQLGISRLVFTRYEDSESIKDITGSVRESSMASFISNLLEVMDPWKPSRRIVMDNGTGLAPPGGSTIGAITFEWGTLDASSSGQDLILPYYAMNHPSDRTLELRRDCACGPETGATWIRREYTWYGQVVKELWGETKVGSI